MGKHFWLELMICLPALFGCIKGIDHMDEIEAAYGPFGCFVFIVACIFFCVWAFVLYAAGSQTRGAKQSFQNTYIPEVDKDYIDDMTTAMMYFETFPEEDFYIDQDGFYWDKEYFD